jgi:hypothetical protein
MVEALAGPERELLPGLPDAQDSARAHRKVVEYCKSHRRGRKIIVDDLICKENA